MEHIFIAMKRIAYQFVFVLTPSVNFWCKSRTDRASASSVITQFLSGDMRGLRYAMRELSNVTRIP